MLACAPAEDCGLRHTGKLSPSWLEQQSFGVGDLAWPLFLTHRHINTSLHTLADACRLLAPGRGLQMKKQEKLLVEGTM